MLKSSILSITSRGALWWSRTTAYHRTLQGIRNSSHRDANNRYRQSASAVSCNSSHHSLASLADKIRLRAPIPAPNLPITLSRSPFPPLSAHSTTRCKYGTYSRVATGGAHCSHYGRAQSPVSHHGQCFAQNIRISTCLTFLA